MNNTQFTQRRRIGVAGLLTNQMMGNNQSRPEVGKGATILHYSDRTVAEVISVSEDFKTVKLESLDARYDPAFGQPQMGHQNWILEPTGRFFTVVWKWGGWKTVKEVVEFTSEFKKKHKDAFSFAKLLTNAQREAVYGGDTFPKNVVEGITRKAKSYSPISILFGQKDYHYDWEF